jgi:hypothetical protein
MYILSEAITEDTPEESKEAILNDFAKARDEYLDALREVSKVFKDHMGSTTSAYEVLDDNGQPIRYITNLIGNINFDSSPKANKLYNHYLDFLRLSDEFFNGNDMRVKVVDVRNIDDVATSVISAMVSSATDNAKELILAKINAGKDFMGTYMTALMYGVDFGDFANFMISPNIDKIVHMSMPNIFTGKKNTITSAIKRAKEGPDYKSYFTNNDRQQIFRHSYKDSDMNSIANIAEPFFDDMTYRNYFIDKSGNVCGKWVYRLDKILARLAMHGGKGAEAIIKIVERLESCDTFKKPFDYEDGKRNDFYGDFNPFDTRQTHVYRQAARYFKDVKKWANDIINSPNYMQDVLNFENFYEMSKETEILGRRLSINQGFKVDLYGQYNYNRQLTKYIYDKVTKGLDQLSDEAEYYKDLLFDFCIKAKIKGPKQYVTPGEQLNALDVSRWNDPDPAMREAYREFITKVMKIITSKVDPIDIVANHPSYNAMVETENFAINMFGGSVVRYNQVIDIAKKLYDDIGHRELTEKEFGTISRFVMDTFIQKFLNNSDKTFIVPEGELIFEYQGRGKYVARQATADTVVKLNTAAGRITFKNLMDNRISHYKSYNRNNEFLSSLCTDDKIDPVTGNKYSYLRVDMDLSNIKTVQEEARYQDMVNSFEVLGNTVSDIGLANMAEEFMIYNMIVNNNAFGSSYFTKIFESSIRPGDSNILTDLFNYIGTFDYLQDSNKMGKFELDSADLEYLRMALAYTRKDEDYINVEYGDYIKIYDKDFGDFKIIKRIGDLDSIKDPESGRIPYNQDVYVVEDPVFFDGRFPTFMQFGPTNVNERMAISNLDIETLIDAYSKGLYSINIRC